MREKGGMQLSVKGMQLNGLGLAECNRDEAENERGNAQWHCSANANRTIAITYAAHDCFLALTLIPNSFTHSISIQFENAYCHLPNHTHSFLCR